MNDLHSLQSDFRFVRDSVARLDRRSSSPYFLWSALVLCGFVLMDVRPVWVGPYWTILGPAGGALTGYLAWRERQRRGEVNRAMGMRHALHWSAMGCVIFLLVFMVGRGITAEALGPIVLLVIALSYFQAGIHTDPPLRWMGLLTIAGYIVVLTVHTYAWSMVGVALAAGLMILGLREMRSRVVEAC